MKTALPFFLMGGLLGGSFEARRYLTEKWFPERVNRCLRIRAEYSDDWERTFGMPCGTKIRPYHPIYNFNTVHKPYDWNF